nr:hypothetical protein [uncultured bacterium]
MSFEQNDGPEFSLRDVMDTLRRRKWVIIQAFVFVSIIGAVTAVLSPPVYSTGARLLVETPETRAILISSGDTSPLYRMRSKQNVETQLEVLRSGLFRERLNKVMPRSEAAIPPQLTFAAQEKTNIIAIAAEGTNPKACAVWANTAAKEYIKLTSETNSGNLTSTIRQYTRLQGIAKRELDVAEQALLLYQQTHQLSSDPNAQNMVREAAIKAQAEATKIKGDLASMETRIKVLNARLSKAPPLVTETKQINNPEMESFRNRIATLKAERAVKLGTFTPESDEIKAIDEEIASLESEKAKVNPFVLETYEKPNPDIDAWKIELAKLELDRDALSSLQSTLAPVADIQVQHVEQFAPGQVELNRLKRRLDNAEKDYLNYSERLRSLSTGLIENVNASAQMLEEAGVPGAPIRPHKAQQVALSMVMGLMLGVGFAFLQEFLDDRVNTSDDVERITSLPVLGVVPTIPDDNNRLLIGQDAFSPITESYRSLRTAVQYSTVDRKVQFVGVSSAHPGEGKSVTSANLGIAMALQGKRVILIDADLRRPSVHRMFRIEAEPGLTSVLAGEVSLEDALHSTTIEGFFVLPSGPLPPNPPELLNSQAMMDLLQLLKEHADVVIFDTPPTVPVTDAQVLGTHLDGMVLVVEAGQARKAAVKHARELLNQTHTRLLGVVLNKIDQSSKGYYHYYYYRSGYGKYGYRKRGYGYGGYGRGYGYGYGYGYGPEGYGPEGSYGGGYGGYGYGRKGRKLGVGPETEETANVGAEQDQPKLPERLRDWE